MVTVGLGFRRCHLTPPVCICGVGADAHCGGTQRRTFNGSGWNFVQLSRVPRRREGGIRRARQSRGGR